MLNSGYFNSGPEADRQKLLQFLEKRLKTPITSIGDALHRESRQKFKALGRGKVALLYNMLPPEGNQKEKEQKGEIYNSQLAQQLSGMIDFYVCESPTFCIQSADMIQKLAESKPSYLGLKLSRDVEFIKSLHSSQSRPLYLVIGGVNLRKKMELIYSFMDNIAALMIGGSSAYTFLKSRAIPIGNSFHEDELEIQAFQLIEKTELQEIELFLPTDHLISQHLGGNRDCKMAKRIPDRWLAIDLGKKSTATFIKNLRKAATVLWYGPMGMVETEAGAQATASLARSIGQLSIRAGAIGQSTVEQIVQANCAQHFETLIAESEFALRLLSNRPFPGLEILATAK